MSADELSDAREAERQRIWNEAREHFRNEVALIDQVKGMLMFMYGVSAEDAFEMLRWESQHRNVKLRLLAEQISNDLQALATSEPIGRRLSSNSALFVAHRRVSDAADRLISKPTQAQRLVVDRAG